MPIKNITQIFGKNNISINLILHKNGRNALSNLDWLRNKNIIVVGASDGIGKYLAFKLILQYNCKIIGISNNQKQMEQFNERLVEYHNNFQYHIFDATSEKKWEEFSQQLKDDKFNVDILINCVGELPQFNSFDKYTQKDISKTMNANFYSAGNNKYILLGIFFIG